MTLTRKPGRGYRHWTVGIVVAVALVSTLGLWSWVGTGQNDRIQTVARASLAKIASTRHVVWQEQDRFAYELSLNGVVTFDPDNMNAEAVTYNLDGLLCVRVLEVRNGKTQIGMQLSNLVREHQGVSDPRLLDAMSLPFVVQFEGAMPSIFQFPEGLSVDVQNELSELIRGFQVMLPDQPSRQWSTLEANQDGRYRASYQIDSRGI